MPSASGTQNGAPASSRPPARPSPPADNDPNPDTDPDLVLAAERAHLLAARQFLRLMRENVLSLEALGGDRVSVEYLKADLHRRAESLHDLPDTPLFFGRLDYSDEITWPDSNAGASPTRRSARRRSAWRRSAWRRGEPRRVRQRLSRRAVPHRPPPCPRPGGPSGRDRLAGARVPAVLPGQPGRADGTGAPPQVRFLRRGADGVRGRGLHPGRTAGSPAATGAAPRGAGRGRQPDPDRRD